jgi:hypothetical protein
MGKIDLFNIELNRTNGIYFAGECVEGNIAIRVKDRLKINAVTLNISGRARVHW